MAGPAQQTTAAAPAVPHYFSGFLHVPPGGDPAQFFEFADKPPSQLVRYGKDWLFVAN